MDYAPLLGLIEADPNLVASATAGDCGGAAAALNAPTIPIKVQYQLTTLGVLAVLGPIRGTAVMQSLRAAASFVEIVRMMDQVDAGVNLNHPDADAMFAQLVAAGTITQAESDKILALRDSTTSRAVQTLGGAVTPIDVALAWRSKG